MIRKYFNLYAAGYIIFFTFRLILYFTYNKIETHKFSELCYSLWLGSRFDLVILGYINFIPLSIVFMSGKLKLKQLHNIVFALVCSIYLIAYFISLVDIIYFHQYHTRLNFAVLHWFDNPEFITKLIVYDVAYALPLFIFILSSFAWFRFCIRIFKNQRDDIHLNMFTKLIFLGLLFVTIRGRVDKKSPIRVGTAYFCENSFLNELGLNGNFTLLSSWLDHKKIIQNKLKLTTDEIADKILKKDLSLNDSTGLLFIDTIKDTQENLPKNIVLILMESMGKSCFSAATKEKTTPFLDSLIHQSIYFSNIYSSGIHTFNGIFSTLFSIPSFSNYHPLKLTSKRIKAFPYELKRLGYTNVYFTSHDGQFDNVEGFLIKNDFSQVISDDHYPIHERKTNLGVTDDYLLRASIETLNQTTGPFFAAIMTSSNHTPFYVPEYFKTSITDERNKVIAYSDYALKLFFEEARKSIWYNNTIFVLVADHGIPREDALPISLSYNEIPLIIFDPSNPNGKIIENLGTQIDIMPSLFAFLNRKGVNRTFGKNILKTKRNYIVFNYDDKFAVVNDSLIYIEKFDSSFHDLYDLKTKNSVKLLHKVALLNMQNYGRGIMQSTSNYLINDRNTIK